MKIQFIDNVPHITPETQTEEDQLFDWYEKQGQKRVDSVISFEWLPRALAKSLDELINFNKPHVSDAVCHYRPCLDQYNEKCLNGTIWKICNNRQTER